jgi:hypothetical protein
MDDPCKMLTMTYVKHIPETDNGQGQVYFASWQPSHVPYNHSYHGQQD